MTPSLFTGLGPRDLLVVGFLAGLWFATRWLRRLNDEYSSTVVQLKADFDRARIAQGERIGALEDRVARWEGKQGGA